MDVRQKACTQQKTSWWIYFIIIDPYPRGWKDPWILKDLGHRLHQLRLGHRVHALLDDLVEAVAGALPQHVNWQVVEEEAHEPLVSDETDVDPRDVDAHDLQTEACQLRIGRLIIFLHNKI